MIPANGKDLAPIASATHKHHYSANRVFFYKITLPVAEGKQLPEKRSSSS
jgi:hypothetical protein